jgi:hypothetical protein
MGGLELQSAGPLSDGELAALLTASYEGYVVPLALDAAAVRFLTDTFALDRGASRIAVRNRTPVGLANLGVRGTEAWIGGRGRSVGAARAWGGRSWRRSTGGAALGVERVWLEVIVRT